MGIDIYSLALDYPDTIIQVKASDLVEAARVFIEDLDLMPERETRGRKETSETNESEKPKTLLTKREVMKLLGVGETTLWRWAAKYDYLHPVMIGGKRCWKRKDIEAIMEGNVADYYGKPIRGSEKIPTLVREAR
jgi:predicted DNA-binding transcriptional regulator AlpA